MTDASLGYCIAARWHSHWQFTANHLRYRATAPLECILTVFRPSCVLNPINTQRSYCLYLHSAQRKITYCTRTTG
jgi:hypothetical protein